MDAKTTSFIMIMGVLGNVLFAISFYVGPIAPGVNLDFSLIAAFIAGFYGGPIIGFVSGLFVGVLPGIMFGPMGSSSWLGLIGLPLGKALSGLTSGLISSRFHLERRSGHSLLAVPSTLLAYVPEGLFTYAYFVYFMPFFLGSGGGWLFFLILPKALAEVTVISVLIAALMGNKGFNDFIQTLLPK